MVIAADYPFMEVFWSILVFFAWVAWIILLVRIVADIFRRKDISGWGKAGWCVFVVFLPFLGVLTYLIANGREMGERDLEEAKAARAQLDDYVRATAGTGDGAASEIEKAKQLLDSGAITQPEYEQIKARAIA